MARQTCNIRAEIQCTARNLPVNFKLTMEGVLELVVVYKHQCTDEPEHTEIYLLSVWAYI